MLQIFHELPGLLELPIDPLGEGLLSHPVAVGAHRTEVIAYLMADVVESRLLFAGGFAVAEGRAVDDAEDGVGKILVGVEHRIELVFHLN